jgi:SIT4-associating protein SAP185/190
LKSQWLQSQGLIPQLLAYLEPNHNPSTQTSAGDFIKAIITISANATTQDQSVIGPNELTRQLVSDPCIGSLIDDMLKGGNPLTVGVGIIIEVIRKNNSDYDLENQIGPVPKNSDPIYLGTLLRQFAKHIPQFMELVNNSNQTVTNKDGSTAVKKRELKTAFGKEIEPLGFDRFKTCELMAELLHCSNMALLNERGGEAEVRRRDAERERLKAEGKLTSKSDVNADFSTSVDSHGFHHARAPSNESPEELKKLEVQNNSEDDFEKVTAPEPPSDEMKEKEKTSESLPTKEVQNDKAGDDGEFVDEPLSPVKENPSSEAASTPARPADDAESPTSAGLSAKVGGLDLDNDTVMGNQEGSTEAKDGKTESKEKPSLLSQQLNLKAASENVEPAPLSPHPDDLPAPLFSKKPRDTETPEESKTPKADVLNPSAGVAESEGSGVTPIDDASSSQSVLFGGVEGQYAPQYEVDIDGSPVVGDLLKMMFVENKVVPTILVSGSHSLANTDSQLMLR